MIRITQSRLMELLKYDPETGDFTRLVARGNRPSGAAAGHLKSDGYVAVTVDGIKYTAHRLAWLYMTGEWPLPECDHRDTNRSNNRWSNLRAATRSQNKMNSKMRSDSRNRYKGVKRERVRFGSRIWVDGKCIYLGCFESEAAAAAAYHSASIKYFGEFAKV